MPKLQNLRTSTASKRPVAANLDPGQIAINYEASDPAIYFKGADGSLIKVAPLYIGSTAPNATPGAGGSSGNSVGELWLDTSNSGKVLKYWDGSNWQQVTASTITSILGPTLGGTGQSVYTLGDLLYSDGSNSLAKLAGNTTATKQFLTQTGTGTVSAAPAWGTIAAADVSGLAASATTNALNATNISSGTLNAARLPSVNLGTTSIDLTRASGAQALSGISNLSIPKTANAPATPTDGFTFYANSSNALSWKGQNGYIRTFDGTANTADRSYTLPDASGTLVLSSSLAASATTDTTNASNISSGTLNAARLPSVNIGTTSVDLTRASGALALAGISTLTFPTSANPPATPAAGFTFYANSSNALSWKGANGYIRVFDGTANTADRTYTLPDASGTLVLTSSLAASATTDTTNATNISSGTLNAARLGTTGAPQFASVAVGTALATNVKVDVSGAYAQVPTAVSVLAIDCSAGNYFTKTINADSTFTVSNVPASRSYSFTLELTQTSGTVTWFSGVIWPGGTAPTLTTGKTHLFFFQTSNGGTTWRAASLINYAS